jgi:L-ribulose-5-phosphate 3-epimerase UlaE
MFTIVLQRDVEGKVSISLDAWTSSNNFAFMAIVAHYITKAGQLEELLIDFREMDGAHTGANMAEATWDTLTRFGLENRVSEVKISCMYFTLTAHRSWPS